MIVPPILFSIRFVTLSLVLLMPIPLPTQTLSLRECEQAFLKNNLLLLAEQFSVEAADARILQATR
jgi:cobalt-zinc-cadmium efflux system outer membrane protein